METTQSFRLAGTTDILEIPCDQDDGQIVIYWDAILEAFPETIYIKNGNTLVRKLNDPGLDGSKPHRIKHHPGVILDVIVSPNTTPSTSDFYESTIVTPKLETLIDPTNNTTERASDPIEVVDIVKSSRESTLATDAHTAIQDVSPVARASASGSQGSSINMTKDPNTALSFKEAVSFSNSNKPDYASKHHPVASLPLEIHIQSSESPSMHDRIDQAIQNGQVDRLTEQLMECLHDLTEQMDKNNELASKNNELVSQVKDLMLMNNEMASRINELTLKITELTSTNMESTALVIKLQEQFNVKQDEMKELQIQALNHLALLQSRVQILMNQTYELHEYPIPRLFVVLPQDTLSWNTKNLMSNKFRLYFLCECGDHTRRTTSKIPHHIHLAKHEGYEITRPTEFFQQYGHYVLTILKMLKFGVAVAGVAIPALTLLVRAEALDKASSSLKMLIGNLQTGMDQAIRGIEKSTADNGEPDSGASGQMKNNEALEGADLRKLETFLKNKDKNKVLGNLYRTTTSEGHVKWVCIDHYRENYHEKTARLFRDTVESMGGWFDETVGRVRVHIRSKIQADQFYGALENAKSVYELEIGLDWDTTYSDFKKLRDCLVKSNVGALYINLHGQDTPASDILNRGKRHDPILDIMRHPTICSVSIAGAPDDFIRRSSLVSRNEHFPNLRTLEIDLMEFQKDIPGLKALLSKMSNLTKLIMNDSGDKVDHVCGACNSTQSFQGSLEVNGGRVVVRIRSRIQAELVYQMLDTSKSLHGLAVDLQVHLKGVPADDIPERVQRHDSIFKIMHHPSTHSVVIIGAPGDLIQRSSLLSTNDNFSNLKNLYIDVSASKQDISGIKVMVSRMPELTSLTVSESEDKSAGFCGSCNAMDSLGRSFKVDDDHVKIHLRSRVQAELVHQVLENTTTIRGCAIDLRVELEDGITGDTSDRIRGHDSVFNIMRHPSTHSVIIVEPPEDFVQQSSLLSKGYGFPNVQQLGIDLTEPKRDIPGLKALVSRMLNLAGLAVNDSKGESNDDDSSSRTVERRGKSFEVNGGRVKIHIGSRIQLDLVYQAFETIQSIYGLDIDLTVDMACISTGDIPDRIQQHDAIFNIMRHPSAHSVTITGTPSDFIQHSSLVHLSRTDGFPSLKHVSLDMSAGLDHDIPGVKVFLSQIPNLSSLALKDSCESDSKESSQKRLFEVDGNRTKFHIWSGIHAELVSHILSSLKSISEFGIDLCVELEDNSAGDISDRITVHDLVFGIIQHPSTQSVVLVRPPGDLIQQSSMLSRTDRLLHLQDLDIDLCMLKQDLSGVKALLSRMPNLTFMRMNDSKNGDTQIQVDCNPLDSLEEAMDGSSHRAKIHLGSSMLRELMDELLSRSKGAQEVDVRLAWNANHSDLKRLRDGLSNSRAKTVKLDLNLGCDSNDDETTLVQRNDAFFDVMGDPSIDSITIMKPPKDLIRHSNVLSRRDEFSNLRHLFIDMWSEFKEDISGLSYLVSKAPNLSDLTFHGGVNDVLLLGLYNAIAQYQRYPITFNSRSLVVPPWTATRQPDIGNQHLTHLLSLVRIQLGELLLGGLAGEEAAMDAITKLEKSAIGLKSVKLTGSLEGRGDEFFENVASVISKHELDRLEIELRWGIGGVRVLEVLEGDQWKHLRDLRIFMGKEQIGARVMKAVVVGRGKWNGPIELNYFDLGSSEKMSDEHAALLQSFMASMSTKILNLWWHMDPSQMESVLNSMDMSRLEEIMLSAKGYLPSQGDTVLDCLTRSHCLRKMRLNHYTPAQEQIQRMQQRGVQLN